MTVADQIVQEAYAAFDKWCRQHDPEGELSILEAVEAYGRWCDAGNRVELSAEELLLDFSGNRA